MQTNETLYSCFATALTIPPETVNDELMYNTIPQWDSVAHMALIAELEQTFDVMFDTDDIIAMNSVAKAREILVRHGITFE